MATTTYATLPLLHRFLGIGLVMLATTFFILRYFEIALVLVDGRVTQLIAYAMSGAALVLAFVAYVVLKPRVPERMPGQSVDQFWSTPAVGTTVLPVWFCLEGAGTVAIIGYYFTGEPVSLIATGLGIVAFWLCGPNVFAKA